jgi:hypothetical protein
VRALVGSAADVVVTLPPGASAATLPSGATIVLLAAIMFVGTLVVRRR